MNGASGRMDSSSGIASGISSRKEEIRGSLLPFFARGRRCAGLPRRGPPLVAVPADRALAAPALARRGPAAPHALPRALGGARPRAAQPLAREDRLLPAARLPGPLPGDRPLPRRRALEEGRPRVGRRRAARRGRRRSSSSLARPPRVPDEWLPGRLPACPARGRPRRGRVLPPRRRRSARRPRASTAALASLVAAAWLVLVVFFLPAFVAAQPNRAIVADVARERQYRPDLRMAFCSDPTRVRRDVLLHVRLAAFSECDLWSLAGSREPFLLLATPAQDASFRADPRYREVARYRYLPASALTLGGLVSLREAGRDRPRRELRDARPRGRAQAEARVPQGDPGGASGARGVARAGPVSRPPTPRPGGTPRPRRRPSRRSRPRRGRARRRPPRTAPGGR